MALFCRPAHGADHLTIAAYNLDNAFDVFDDPYTVDETTDVKPRWQWKEIARAIRAIDADVVTFSEVENEHVLRAMTRVFLADQGYEHFAVNPTNSGRGICLGVMSRRPISRLASYRLRDLKLPDEPETWRFARDLMQVSIPLKGQQQLELFIAHFKSKRDSAQDPQSARWRLVEAIAVRQIVAGLLEKDPLALVAVIGDLNDTPDSQTLSVLLKGGITSLEPDRGLVDVHAALPPEKRITYLREPYRSTVDYILVSPHLNRYYVVPGSAGVLADPKLLSGSDHAPVSVTLKVLQ